MTVALQTPWTAERFFTWAERQEGRYEFDGVRPVAMTGGLVGHAMIMRRLHYALDLRLRGSACEMLGPDAGLATTANAIRYPDALITYAKLDQNARTVAGVVVVFEIVSPTSIQNDFILKMREYAAVASIRQYVIIESAAPVVVVLSRADADALWTAERLTAEDVLALPEVGVQLPVAEIYAGLEFSQPED